MIRRDGALRRETNSLLPDVYFGSNGYISDPNPRDPGDATWTIESGGGSNDVYGTIMAGGDAAEAYNNGTSTTPPDPSVLDEVINVPSDDIFQGTEDRIVMKQEYDLPPVDVYNLPPKEILGTIPSVGDWFNGYNATTPESSTGYYSDRLNRAPYQSELESAYVQGSFTGSGTLTPADSGVYTSFQIGGDKTSGTLNISGGDVVIYVTSYGDVAQAASFYMGNRLQHQHRLRLVADPDPRERLRRRSNRATTSTPRGVRPFRRIASSWERTNSRSRPARASITCRTRLRRSTISASRA